MQELSLVVARGSYSLVAVCGLLTMVTSLAVEHRLLVLGFSRCSSQAQLPRGILESSQIRD